MEVIKTGATIISNGSISGIAVIIFISVFSMMIGTIAIAWIANGFFNAVSRNPSISQEITGQLFALAAMVELAILIVTAVILILVFKL